MYLLHMLTRDPNLALYANLLSGNVM